MIRLMPEVPDDLSISADVPENDTDAEGIAHLLTKHWGDTFRRKPTRADIRAKWCNEEFERLHIDSEAFRPTLDDVRLVFKGLSVSSPGPDGIPFELYRIGQDLLIDVFYEVATAMYDGRETPDDSFNNAYLVCLPKAATGCGSDGVPYFVPSSTRPLSIVDASNRILASIFRIGLERATKDWVSHYQQGFVPGRQLLRNVVDVDHAAQKVSIKHQRGAIVLLDLRAAFPSVAHDYMWDVLKAIGVPQAMLQALQLFYQQNQHFIKAAGQVFPSFTCTSGVS
jgi:hypothetical protein